MRAAVVRMIDELVADLAMEKALAEEAHDALEETYDCTIRRLEEIRDVAEGERTCRADGPERSALSLAEEERSAALGVEGRGGGSIGTGKTGGNKR